MEPLHAFFGPDPESYNSLVDGRTGQDGSCRPGIAIVASAVAFWANQKDAPPKLGEAALVFNMPIEAVRDAVEWHPFMQLLDSPTVALGDRRIGIVSPA